MKHFKTISEFHRFRELPPPQHPLLSVFRVDDVKHLHPDEPTNLVFDFYGISLKRVANVKVKYGQEPFDFNEGILSFMAPQQVISLAFERDEEIKQSGWVIYIHPDFLWNTPLAKTIKQYDFWDYTLREALYLSEKEEATINQIIENIQREYQANLDHFSKKIMIAQLESLLSYAERFYHRQFLTREKANHQLLTRLETLLEDYFASDDLARRGLPTVHYVADQLHLSPKYLSSVLRVLTGQTTQQHIHEKLIARAKEQLSTTDLTVSEIAYALGFEHLPSFSKLFKIKTSQSPLEFRQSFQ
ncbi:Helix-turn-helix domain-containing protein [Catalinimonas alkaloidigena]|uniref:Helix-turn-helix domain-containing protein n=1 Tax=Catalinimonas alkaloidigena TaxID=1075417 RepID=A0A1G9KRF3_9BACT|nr:response regulator transcription factor [Catalinimonas alkaloidigena]SDL52232.1 Helix-turn-helix domain-containing protein [Catalinimonas alkaloidigena]